MLISTLVITIIALIIAIIGFFLYKNYAFRNAGKKIANARYERIESLHHQLENKQTPSPEEMNRYASNLLTREMTFLLLKKYKQTQLFPKEFYTIEKGAASNLASWLEFPTELDACPSELEHIKRVILSLYDAQSEMYYEVFRFRINQPHWAAKNGWMLGVVGPYTTTSQPYDPPQATFSRLSKLSDNITPEEEVQWVHETIYKAH